jgi:hypothetical protein
MALPHRAALLYACGRTDFPTQEACEHGHSIISRKTGIRLHCDCYLDGEGPWMTVFGNLLKLRAKLIAWAIVITSII